MIRLPMIRRAPQGSDREVAIHWIAREVEGVLSPEDAQGLEAWLDGEPGRRMAYEQARQAVGAANLHSAHPEMMALRQEALAALPARRESILPYGAAAAAVLAAAVLGLGWMGLRPNVDPAVSRIEAVARSVAPALDPRVALYSTRVGERSSVTLPDGSVATLNTDTQLKIAYTDGERGVRLVRGQALFQVAKNRRVPFRVYAADRRITAVGTTFDVRVERGKVRVALVEGVVSVASDPPKPSGRAPAVPLQQVVMTAGEVLEAAPASTMSVRSGDAQGATAWRAGLVSFRAASLAEAVAEINRYTDRPLSIADPSIAGYRITGVFRTGDPERFARAAAEVLPVSVEVSADGSMILARDTKKTSPGE
jgi:transmembrane sensor